MRSVFERYAIVPQADIMDAMKMLQSHQNGHSFGHSEPEASSSGDSTSAN